MKDKNHYLVNDRLFGRINSLKDLADPYYSDEDITVPRQYVKLANQGKAPGQKQYTSADGKKDIYLKDKNRELENNRLKSEVHTDPEHKDSYPEDMHLNYGGDDHIMELMNHSKTPSD